MWSVLRYSISTTMKFAPLVVLAKHIIIILLHRCGDHDNHGESAEFLILLIFSLPPNNIHILPHFTVGTNDSMKCRPNTNISTQKHLFFFYSHKEILKKHQRKQLLEKHSNLKITFFTHKKKNDNNLQINLIRLTPQSGK